MSVADGKPSKTITSGFSFTPEVRENAILIYGPRKAGTTLLQRLIDGSSLYVYPTEFKVKQLGKAEWMDKEQFLEEFRQRDRLSSEPVDGFDQTKFEKEQRRTANQSRSLRDAILLTLEAAISSSPAGNWTGWAVKEVGGDFDIILADWKKMFLDSKFVVILRNPFFVSRSVFRKRYQNETVLSLREVIRQIIQPWLVLRTVSAHMDRKDLHVLYYEDVVSDTGQEMRAVADFLGIDVVPSMLQPTMFGVPTVVRTSAYEKKSVFRDRKRYWSGLKPREAVLLSLIGGVCYLMNLILGRIVFKDGAVRLAAGRRLRHA